MYTSTIPVMVTNEHFNKEKTLKEIKRCGAEKIALAVSRELGHSFSTPENIEKIKELIDYYRKNGLDVIVWMGESFGHDGGPAMTDSPYTNIRFIDKGDINAFCPLDTDLKKDLCEWVKKLAKCGADVLLIDDDFRLGYRGGLGCCCDLHMAEFEKELGEKVPLDQLRVKIFNGGKNKYRDAWLKVQRNSMYDMAKAMRNALNEINPDARLGICCTPGRWDCEGTDTFELAKILAGNTKPLMRPMGAPYWAATGHHKLGEVVEYQRTQFDWCKDFDGEIISEGDAYPRPRYTTPASYVECFDMILRAAGGSDGILKYVIDYISNPEYETGYIDAWVDNKEIYAAIDKHFSDKKAIGVRPYNVIHMVENAELNANEPNFLNDVQNYPFQPSLRFATMNALPISYDKGNVNILFGENARYISEDELKYGNIIDITAAKILTKRGIDVGIEKFEDENNDIPNVFSNVPREYFFDENEYVPLDYMNAVGVTHKKGVRMLSEFNFSPVRVAGAFEYENSDGMRFLVYPFDALKVRENGLNGWFNSYSRRRQVIKSIEWLGSKKLPAAADGNYPGLYILAKENEDAVCIGLWNLFDDKIPKTRIKTEAVGETEFINCNGHRENDTIVLDSVLYPYEFAAFEIKKNKK